MSPGHYLLAAAVAWLVLSIPVAVLTGACIAHAERQSWPAVTQHTHTTSRLDRRVAHAPTHLPSGRRGLRHIEGRDSARRRCIDGRFDAVRP